MIRWMWMKLRQLWNRHRTFGLFECGKCLHARCVRRYAILKWTGTSYEHLQDIAENPVVDELIIDDLLPHVTIHGHRVVHHCWCASIRELVRWLYKHDWTSCGTFWCTLTQRLTRKWWFRWCATDIALFQVPGQLTEIAVYGKSTISLIWIWVCAGSEFSPYLMKLGSVGVDVYVVSWREYHSIMKGSRSNTHSILTKLQTNARIQVRCTEFREFEINDLVSAWNVLKVRLRDSRYCRWAHESDTSDCKWYSSWWFQLVYGHLQWWNLNWLARDWLCGKPLLTNAR